MEVIYLKLDYFHKNTMEGFDISRAVAFDKQDVLNDKQFFFNSSISMTINGYQSTEGGEDHEIRSTTSPVTRRARMVDVASFGLR